MSSMEQLYQQILLDHAKAAHGRGLAQSFDGESFQVNPTCGDQLRLRVSLDDSGAEPKIDAITWEGRGCSISQASASVMTELVDHASVATVEELSQAFWDLMRSRGEGIDAEAADLLGDAIAFEGVSRYPARIKCALLGWMALRDALAKAAAGDHSPAHIPEGI